MEEGYCPLQPDVEEAISPTSKEGMESVKNSTHQIHLGIPENSEVANAEPSVNDESVINEPEGNEPVSNVPESNEPESNVPTDSNNASLMRNADEDEEVDWIPNINIPGEDPELEVYYFFSQFYSVSHFLQTYFVYYSII